MDAEAKCHDCDAVYGDPGFPDLIIPHEAWIQISPSRDGMGLLCPSCMCRHLSAQGIETVGAFTSGPITSVSPEAIEWIVMMESQRDALGDAP